MASRILGAAPFWLLSLVTLGLMALAVRSLFATDYAWVHFGQPGTADDQRWPKHGVFRSATRVGVSTGQSGAAVWWHTWEQHDGSFVLIERGPLLHTRSSPSYPTWQNHHRLVDTRQPPDVRRGWTWLGGATASTIGLQSIAENPNASLPREPSQPNVWFMTFERRTTHIVVPLPVLIALAGIYPSWRLWRWRRSAGHGFPIEPVADGTLDGVTTTTS